jgi:hypothetical protein
MERLRGEGLREDASSAAAMDPAAMVEPSSSHPGSVRHT